MSTSGQPTGSTDVREERRSTGKPGMILEAATTLFLRNGYRGTSMDDVAALAGVSKQTVYKHFADKESLFSEIVSSTVDEVSEPVHREVRKLEDTGDVEADLRDLARRQLSAVMQPRLLQLRRLVIGEVGRFPEAGRIFYERGPERAVATLAAALERLAARGVLRVDDPILAASHFNWLTMAYPMSRAMLVGDDDAPTPGELDRYAETGVRVFLAAYGRR
jgi:TetR/AcrR family transcriptional regulator, mexJK operon transcriptional repressor